jgi:hypothetical protein
MIFLFSLILILYFLAIAHGIDLDENCSSFSRSTLDACPVLPQTSDPACMVLYWPLMFSINYNNPPRTPNAPSGNASGVPGINYSYLTLSIDPEGDQMLYSFDWGDGAVSNSSLVESGITACANHAWTRGGTYQVKARATDSKGAISGWSGPLNVTIDSPPGSPSIPSGPASGRPGILQTYTVSAVDPDGDQIMYTFNWGDGSTSAIGLVDSGTAASANHTWKDAGTYQIIAMATDRQGRSSEWSEPLTIELNNPPNNPSTPSGPSSSRPGIPCAYSISATDPDGDQISYTFDWGDGSTTVIGPVDSGAIVGSNHTWAKGGRYQVRADATDSRGATSGSSEAWIVTINAPPNRPSISSEPASVYAWASNNFSASVIDPDEDPMECTFDWGDGNTSTTKFITSGNNTSASHSWSKEGTYQIKVIAVDSNREPSEWSPYLTINVIANNKPNAPISLFGASSGYVGIKLSYFTLADDPDNDRVNYTLDWGDGTFSTTNSVDSGSVENASHAWSKAGMYQVKGIAIDSKGAQSMWSKSLNVIIADNRPPAIPVMPSGPTSGHSVISYKYSTSATDPDGNLVRYVFDWGDGTTSWTGLGFIESGTRESVLHKWSRAGTYRVKAMSTDDKGAESGWSNPLTVKIS